MQRDVIAALGDDKIGGRKAVAEFQNVMGGIRTVVLLNGISAIAPVEQIGVGCGAAEQRIVAGPPGECV